MGLTATIDLTGRAVVVTPTPAADLDRFLGGRGLGLKLLWQHVHGPLDPFGPANPLIFTVGPFTGTVWPAGARGPWTGRRASHASARPAKTACASPASSTIAAGRPRARAAVQ